MHFTRLSPQTNTRKTHTIRMFLCLDDVLKAASPPFVLVRHFLGFPSIMHNERSTHSALRTAQATQCSAMFFHHTRRPKTKSWACTLYIYTTAHIYAHISSSWCYVDVVSHKRSVSGVVFLVALFGRAHIAFDTCTTWVLCARLAASHPHHPHPPIHTKFRLRHLFQTT